MPDIKLNSVKLVRIDAVNSTVSGMSFELTMNISHTVSSINPDNNQFNAITKIEIERQKPDQVFPLHASFELCSVFTASSSDVSTEDVFNNSAILVFPFIQKYLDQLFNMISIATIKLPDSAIPKYPK